MDTNLENGGQVDVIYTDFEKEFDNVSHQRLLSQLSSYGVRSDLITWIEMFLRHRNYKVRVNGRFSQSKLITSGIP